MTPWVEVSSNFGASKWGIFWKWSTFWKAFTRKGEKKKMKAEHMKMWNGGCRLQSKEINCEQFWELENLGIPLTTYPAILLGTYPAILNGWTVYDSHLV